MSSEESNSATEEIWSWSSTPESDLQLSGDLSYTCSNKMVKGMGPRPCSRGFMDRYTVKTVSHAYETGSHEQFRTPRLGYFWLTGHHTQMPAESWFHREKATEILLNGASPGTRPTHSFLWWTLVCFLCIKP